ACGLPMCIQFLRPNATGRSQIIAQLKFRIFQESRKFPPQCEGVLASLAECAGGQCNRLRCLDLAANIAEKRLGCFLTPDMARRRTQRLSPSFRTDGKQFVHPSPQSKLQPGLVDLAAPPRKTVFCMSPTSGMYHVCPSDLVISRVSIGLENAFELSQKSFRSITSTA